MTVIPEHADLLIVGAGISGPGTPFGEGLRD